jgi:hypothetical protein
MKSCDAEACPSCALPEGSPACLRHKAHFCTWLAEQKSSGAVREALAKMSLDLMEEAKAIEKELVYKKEVA